jgi:Zn-dependent peptidase ImmA (M78 family)
VNNADTMIIVLDIDQEGRKIMKFKINNREWKIIEASQQAIKNKQNIRRANEEENLKSIDTRYYGITYCDEQKIYIDEDLPKDRKKATLIHELTHCYIDNYITHCEKQYSEEDVADIVANSYDIIHEIVEQYERNNGVNIEQGIDSILLDGKPILYCERQK